MDREKIIDLRRRARGLLDQHEQLNLYVFSMEMSGLITELDTYSVELERQNEELRNANKELENTRLKYLTLHKLSPSGYLTLDGGGCIAEASEGVVRMLKVDGRKLLSQKFATFIHVDNRDIFHRLSRQLRDCPEQQQCRLRLVPKDASPLHVQLEAVMVEESGEDGGKMLICLTDITEFIWARQEIVAINEELEHRFERRTLQLLQAQNRLLHSEQLGAIAILSASIALELNNPLQGVLNAVKGIRRRAQLSDEDAELVDQAVTECKRMGCLLTALEDFNQRTSGEPAPFDLHKTLDSVLLLHRKLLATRNITLEKLYGNDILSLYGVADQIKQVVMTLLSNSIDACRDGGAVSIATGVKDSGATLTISHNGAGLDPHHRRCISEPFFSAGPDVTDTSLGLFVSQGIVNNHKGSIEVKSTPGEETVYRVRLPVGRSERC